MIRAIITICSLSSLTSIAQARDVSVTVDGQTYQCSGGQGGGTVVVGQTCITVPFPNASCGNYWARVRQGIDRNSGAVVWQSTLSEYKGTPSNCSCAECTYPNPEAARVACRDDLGFAGG